MSHAAGIRRKHIVELTHHRYRNMCRFNSGVRISLTEILQRNRKTEQAWCFCRIVLLSPRTTPAVPLLLARRVRLYFAYTRYMLTLADFRPDVHFHCDVNFDPFLYMQSNNKTYGTQA